MIRLVVLHQLIASLLLGPLLCCCTATRLGHATHATAKSDATGTQGQRKSCCGRQETSRPGGPEAPNGGDSPAPTQCPCKGHSHSAMTVPEAVVASAVPLNCFDVANSEFALLLDVAGGSPNSFPASAYFTSRSQSLSKSDLLFAHHNLRC